MFLRGCAPAALLYPQLGHHDGRPLFGLRASHCPLNVMPPTYCEPLRPWKFPLQAKRGALVGNADRIAGVLGNAR